MAAVRSRLERVAEVSSLDIDVSPVLEQPLDDLAVAAVRSRLQRVAVVSSLRVDVGPHLEQPLDDLVVAAVRSRLERVAVPSSWPRGAVPFFRRRGAVVSSLRVDVSPLLE